jgi:predicted nicotinamide N-methyase
MQAMRLLSAAVGPRATGFARWLEEQDMPEPADLIRAPAQWAHDARRPDRTWAALQMCADYAVAHVEHWPACWAVLDRALETGATPGVVTPACMTLVSQRPPGGLVDGRCKHHVRRVAQEVKDVQRLVEGLET